MSAPECVEINLMAVIRGHHRETGQAAFGGFALLHDRQSVVPAEMKHPAGSHSNGLEGPGKPTEEGPPLQDDVCSQQHVRLEWNGLSESLDVRAVQSSDDSIGRF